jgi:hypothetical protein
MGRMNGAPSNHREMLAQPCWYCRHFGRMGGAHSAVCLRDGGHLRSQPETGCAFFERVPGVDDDGWKPLLRNDADGR